MAELTREEFLVHMQYLMADVGDIKKHLQMLNGRTGTSEQELARLDERMKDVDDRLQAAAREGKDNAARWGAGAVGVGVAVVEVVRQIWHR